MVLDDKGIISGPLRFRDEFVRHKVMDLIGDLALLGRPLEGRIHARKAGHALHIEFARALNAALLNPERRDDGGRRRAARGQRRAVGAHSPSSFVSSTCSAEKPSSLR